MTQEAQAYGDPSSSDDMHVASAGRQHGGVTNPAAGVRLLTTMR